MKLKQKPGEEKLLISKQKAITLECLMDVPAPTPTPTPANYFFEFYTQGILIPISHLLIIGKSFQTRKTF